MGKHAYHFIKVSHRHFVKHLVGILAISSLSKTYKYPKFIKQAPRKCEGIMLKVESE